MLAGGEPVEGVVAPGGVPGEQFVAAWQRAVLDEEAADVVPGAGGGQGVEGLVADGGGDGEVGEEGGDVGLVDPGQSAVGPVHGAQRRRYGHERGVHRRGVGVGEEPLHGHREHAAPAAAAVVEFVLGAAGGAVDVEFHAAAGTARRPSVDPPGQDPGVAAGAGAPGAFGGQVAVTADPSVGPGHDELVVLTAARARLGPGGGVAGPARPSHRGPVG